MTGLLGLIGGREHGPGCESIDRHVLAAVAHDDPVVALIPYASSWRTRARTTGRAIAWWEQLGATTVVADPSPDAARPLLERADIIVMTGGVPDRLHRRLEDGGLAAEVAARWRAGAHLLGSSSGAMVVAGARQSVRPPFRVHEAFGLLPGVAVAPHHEQAVPRAVASWRARTHPHTPILGIDEATALVGRGSRFSVLGIGSVVVRRGLWQRTFRVGETVDVARLGVLPTPVLPTPTVTHLGPAAHPPPVPSLRSVPDTPPAMASAE